MHSISHGACAFVLLLTCAYELEGSQDCGRMQLRSDIIDPIGAKRTPLLDTWPLPGSRKSAFKAFFLSKSVGSLVSRPARFVHKPWSTLIVKDPFLTSWLVWEAARCFTAETLWIKGTWRSRYREQSSERDEITWVGFVELWISWSGLEKLSEN
jgi:hypothetical protein